MKPSYRQSIEIILKAWEGRKDSPDYPDYDDINMAIGSLMELVDLAEIFGLSDYETRNEK